MFLLQKKKKRRKPLSLAKKLSGYRSSFSESSDTQCADTAPKKRKTSYTQSGRNETDSIKHTDPIVRQDVNMQRTNLNTSGLNGITESAKMASTSLNVVSNSTFVAQLSDATVNPETQGRFEGAQGQDIVADGSSVSLTSCDDFVILPNVVGKRLEELQDEVTSSLSTNNGLGQNADSFAGDGSMSPSSDDGGEFMDFEPAVGDNSVANSPLPCESEPATDLVEPFKFGEASSDQQSSADQARRNTEGSSFRVDAEIISTTVTTVRVNDSLGDNDSGCSNSSKVSSPVDQVKSVGTNSTQNIGGKGIMESSDIRSSMMGDKNNSDAFCSVSEEIASVSQPGPPLGGDNNIDENGVSDKLANVTKVVDFPVMDDVLQIIKEEENEHDSVRCGKITDSKSADKDEVVRMDNLGVDDTGYRADICIETRLMSPANPEAEVPHGNEGDGELPEEQDMVDDNFNGTSHHDNIDSDEEDIVLSELVKRLRDSSEHRTRATSDREHKEQSCSTSSNRNTRRGDETCGLGRETSQSEGKTTVIEKNSRTKSPQIDSTRATNSVNDSNSTAEVAPDKITVELISGTRERFCKPNSKQKSKTQAKPLAPRKEKSPKGAIQTNGNNLKGDNSGSGTSRNSDIIAGKKDEYVGDVSKAKFRTKDNIFAFDVQTLELLWNFKGK